MTPGATQPIARWPARWILSVRSALDVPRLVIAVLAVITAGLCVRGALRGGPSLGPDAYEHLRFAEILVREGRLAEPTESTQWWNPPVFHLLAGGVQGLVDLVGGRAQEAVSAFALRETVGRTWPLLGLVGLVFVVGVDTQRRQTRLAGVSLLILVGAWISARLLAYGADERWEGAIFFTAIQTGLLVVVAAAVGRQVFRDSHWLPVAVAAGVVATPMVPRYGAVFHPELQATLLTSVGLLAVAVAHRRGWPRSLGVPAGAAFAAAALTRPSTLVAGMAVGVVVLLAGRKTSLGFLAVMTGVVLLLCGPWWVRQTALYGTPVPTNYEAYAQAKNLPKGQPLRFYVDVPSPDLVIRPFFPSFNGQFASQMYADLWSDYYGAQHNGFSPPPATEVRVFLSTQSVLGIVPTLLGLAGLVILGGQALRSMWRRRPTTTLEVFLAGGLLTSAVALAVYLPFVIKWQFPLDNSIKATYLMFVVLPFVVGAVAAAGRLWNRGRWWRRLLGVWAPLYGMSYVGFLATSWPVASP